MALIKCPDCAREVSDRAPACPQCGGPIARAAAAAPVQQAVQTVEATGKDFKAAIFFGVLAILVAIGLLILGFVVQVTEVIVMGGVMFAGGLAAYLYGRLGGWWNHG